MCNGNTDVGNINDIVLVPGYILCVAKVVPSSRVLENINDIPNLM